MGKLTYDEQNKEGPFYAIKYFETDFGTKVLTLFSSNFTNNSKITLALIKAILEIENKNRKISRQEYQALLRYLNMIGGTIILDYLSEDEIKEKLINYYDSNIKQKFLQTV